MTAVSNTSCDTVQKGYQCSPETSHHWGQYSPYFDVALDDSTAISNAIPDGCTLTFAQILSRHGARDPTAGKTALYASIIDKIHANATSYGEGFEFIKAYNYSLGADQLTTFGQQELINSGYKFYGRYESLARAAPPFVRSSGQERVVESARNWTQGYHAALLADSAATDEATDAYPYNIVLISEDEGSNNTLDHGLCTAFEDGVYSEIGDAAQAVWSAIFTPNITARLNANLPGANLSDAETISLMDMCPYNTVADTQGTISEWCDLFTIDEWESYDYYQTLGKYYGHGAGNPLGPTQGVGFTNELIARLTGSLVVDHTSTNHTLDDNEATFPLNRTLYADFSHDNDMTGIYFALGLYNNTPALSNSSIQTAEELDGYSSAWTVPFAARMYVEKMVCEDSGSDELVRVLVNDKVRPLANCDADALGRCTVSKFVESLSFAREGGDWDLCFS